jgi:hypothetical protein
MKKEILKFIKKNNKQTKPVENKIDTNKELISNILKEHITKYTNK